MILPGRIKAMIFILPLFWTPSDVHGNSINQMFRVCDEFSEPERTQCRLDAILLFEQSSEEEKIDSHSITEKITEPPVPWLDPTILTKEKTLPPPEPFAYQNHWHRDYLEPGIEF